MNDEERKRRADYMRAWRAAHPERAKAARQRAQEKRKAEHLDEDRARAREYARRRRAQDPATHAAYMREWRAKNPEKSRAISREAQRRQFERDPEKVREYGRAHARRRAMGLSRERAVELLVQQGGLCAVCRMKPATHADHNHATGRPRGLLCAGCNIAVGCVEMKPERLAQIREYLSSFEE